MPLNNWEPVDYIIFLLAFLIASLMVLYTIEAWGGKINIEVDKMIRDILLTILAIISVYVGSKIKKSDK